MLRKGLGVACHTVAKMFSGARLRRLREERGLTQVALARALDLSTSYVNQLENDQRPITVSVLIALTERFDLPPHYFSSDSDARLVADLSDVFTDTGADDAVSRARSKNSSPGCPRSVAAWSPCTGGCATPPRTGRLSLARDGRNALPPERPMPFEEVRDFFYDRNNYIGDLDVAAEQLFGPMVCGQADWTCS